MLIGLFQMLEGLIILTKIDDKDFMDTNITTRRLIDITSIRNSM